MRRVDVIIIMMCVLCFDVEQLFNLGKINSGASFVFVLFFQLMTLHQQLEEINKAWERQTYLVGDS